jgi:RNA binding exosome subunit
MRNYNWRTKLKTNKNFIKGIRKKIKKNQTNENWNWNTKNREDNCALFLVGEKKEGKKKDIATCDKPSIIHRHTSY